MENTETIFVIVALADEDEPKNEFYLSFKTSLSLPRELGITNSFDFSISENILLFYNRRMD
ncbi:MAG: hypothetical protein VKL39_00585 [Leptolyngbyaceae bacterium]|nr:hypothetical protein [Leptolyngbyaceae bacterium]